MSLFEVKNITVSFGGVKALNDVSEELAVVGYELIADDVEYYRGTTGTHGFFDW